MWLDIVLAIVILGSIITDTVRGGIRGIFALIGIIIGIFTAQKLHTRFATILPIQNQLTAHATAFIIIFFVITLLFYLIGLLISVTATPSPINRFFGFILGTIKGTLIAGVICFCISLFPKGEIALQQSVIAPILQTEFRIIKNLIHSKRVNVKGSETIRKKIQEQAIIDSLI